jgi:hypothetical protein
MCTGSLAAWLQNQFTEHSDSALIANGTTIIAPLHTAHKHFLERLPMDASPFCASHLRHPARNFKVWCKSLQLRKRTKNPFKSFHNHPARIRQATASNSTATGAASTPLFPPTGTCPAPSGAFFISFQKHSKSRSPKK